MPGLPESKLVPKIYVIAEIGRCPRCLRAIDLPAGPPLEDRLERAVCPHCEAIVGVRPIVFTPGGGG